MCFSFPRELTAIFGKIPPIYNTNVFKMGNKMPKKTEEPTGTLFEWGMHSSGGKGVKGN